MDRLRWKFGMRYELSGDGCGLLRYISPTEYYHVHSDEMSSLECRKYRVLKKGKVRYSL